MDQNLRIAENIKLAMIRSRLTMGELESFMRLELGINRNRTSGIANARVSATSEEIYAIAKFFETTVEWMQAEHLAEIPAQRDTLSRGNVQAV